VAALYADGIVGLPAAFRPAWADELREDFETVFREARAFPGGTVSRGENRHYLAVHPERLRRFADLVTLPAVDELCAAVLGPEYEIVEVAFDVPEPGALHQRWHRDFRMPAATRERRELDSLAFNVTTVDVNETNGPFEVVPGSQWDEDAEFEHGMFPPEGWSARYEERSEPRFPRRGDLSARTGLAIHRGTANRSSEPRPVLVVGAVKPEVDTGDAHEIAVTPRYLDSLPSALRRRLRCTVVERLEPIVQKHTIEGLVMGV
jgi:ectoine hydroxylase-related dioxygenase (phytanoyl-CoA dioxygenase family)